MNKKILPYLIVFLCVQLMLTPYASSFEKENLELKNIDITRITSEGRLVIDYENKVAEFYDNVKVQDKNGIMNSNYLKVIFTKDGLNVSKMIAAGNVIIKQKDRTAYSDSAVYIIQTEVLRLIGNPKITEKGNMYTAEEITILVKQNKVLFEPSAKILIKDSIKK
jgi:lipopolysaccharide export system protein LptA